MKKFWVFWTFIANFPDDAIEVEAESPEQAIEIATGWYRKEFQEKATIFVWDRAPVLVDRRKKS